MTHMNFELSSADPAVWMGKEKQKNGEEYYECVPFCVDDCLVISERAESILFDKIGKVFELKEELIGKPSQYLRGKLWEVELENGTTCWVFGSSQYVKTAVKIVEAYSKKKG